MVPDPAMAEPQIRLLGPPRLVQGSRVEPLPVKLAQFLALLAAAPDACLPRETLAETLWDPVRHADPRINLRQLLSQARRNLPHGTAALLVSRDLVRLDATALDLDFWRLLQAETSLDGTRFEPWRGDLLEGTDHTTALFEDWLTVERQRVRGLWARLAVKALDAMTRYGSADPEAVIDLADRMVEVAPDGEDARRAIRTACGRIGRIDLARRYLGPSAVPAKPAPQAAPAGGAEPLRRPRLAVLRPRGQGIGGAFLRSFVADVADALAGFRSFAVLATHSSFAIGHEDGLPTAEDRAGIDYAALATARAQGGTRVLAVRLVDCRDATIAWAAEFGLGEADLADSGIRLVRRVAASLADALERELASHLRVGLSAQAYRRYLDGREAQALCDLPNVRRARRAFRDSAALDPSFAPAQARIAETLFVEWISRGGRDGELLADAQRTAAAALATDPNVAIVHWVSGAVALYQRRWEQVLGHFEDAAALGPHSADLILEHADALSHLGEHDAAQERFALALDLNPRPPDRYIWFGASMALGRLNFAAAAALCDRIQGEEVAMALRAACYAMAGDMPKAQAWAARVREVLPGVTVEDFVRLTPDPPDSEKVRAYREGMSLAGVPRMG